jgi:hypothetical protein
VPRELVERVLRTTLPVGILDDMLRASRASQYVLVPVRRLRLISVAEWGWLCLSREAGGSCQCCIAARGPDVIKAFGVEGSGGRLAWLG